MPQTAPNRRCWRCTNASPVPYNGRIVTSVKPSSRLLAQLALLLPALLAQTALAQDTCRHRGALDPRYCDDNRDLVADTPSDPARLKNPATLAFTYSPVEDTTVYETIFKPFVEYLGKCTGKRTVYYRVQSNAAEIEAMRLGRLHVAGFSTGPTTQAVNQAGAVPFAVKGSESEILGYRLLLIVKKDSPFQKPTDLKGTRVAHVQPTSNSGNLAPRALFSSIGLHPDRDYRVLYSGKHDNSITGVLSGEYDAAPVASGVFNRMAARGLFRKDDVRVLWQSDLFPTTSFAYAHDLVPALRDSIVKCFSDYRFPQDMKNTFVGADRFVPITYEKHWAVVRKVAAFAAEKSSEGTGDPAKPARGAVKDASK